MNAPASQLPWQNSRLLVGLPESTPKMKFVNMQHLEEAVTHQKSESAKTYNASPFLVVFDIPPSTIREQIDSSALGEEIKVQTCLDLSSNILVLEVMKSREHEGVAARFDHYMQTKAEQMGLSLPPRGGATVDAEEYRKEPDASWIPLPEPGLPQRTWPTVVLEVGWSESIKKLAVDAQCWIEAQGSDVQTVITIKIDRTTPKLTIQKWEEASHTRRMTRSQSSHHRTVETKQEVIIAHSNGITTVTETLKIQFEKIFNRPINRHKQTSPQEGNFVFSNQELEPLAETAWRAQGFM